MGSDASPAAEQNSRPTGDAPVIVVSVGTDHHPFDRLVSWMDDWSVRHPEATVVIQRGTSQPTANAQSKKLIPHSELCELFGSATVVISHGGPSTVMDIRAAGQFPIVMPRNPAHGEHVDDHQIRFGDHLQRHGLAKLALDVADLEEAIDDALRAPERYVVPVESGTVPGVVAFGQVVDDLMGTTTPLVVAPR